MATTGRISDSRPNLQEIPRNSPEAERLKAAFRELFVVPAGPVMQTNEGIQSYEQYETDTGKEAD